MVPWALGVGEAIAGARAVASPVAAPVAWKQNVVAQLQCEFALLSLTVFSRAGVGPLRAGAQHAPAVLALVAVELGALWVGSLGPAGHVGVGAGAQAAAAVLREFKVIRLFGKKILDYVTRAGVGAGGAGRRDALAPCVDPSGQQAQGNGDKNGNLHA